MVRIWGRSEGRGTLSELWWGQLLLSPLEWSQFGSDHCSGENRDSLVRGLYTSQEPGTGEAQEAWQSTRRPGFGARPRVPTSWASTICPLGKSCTCPCLPPGSCRHKSVVVLGLSAIFSLPGPERGNYFSGWHGAPVPPTGSSWAEDCRQSCSLSSHSSLLFLQFS